MDLILKRIREARERSKCDDSETIKEFMEIAERGRQQESNASVWLAACRPATARDYARWVRTYIERGGEITDVLEYQFHMQFSLRCDGYHPYWLVAERPFTMTPLYGCAAVCVIVPSEVAVTVQEPGDNKVFRHDAKDRLSWVPIFSDVEELLVKGAEWTSKAPRPSSPSLWKRLLTLFQRRKTL